MIKADRINLTINPENRLNKLNQHAQDLLQQHFSDWSGKNKLSSNFDRINEKMIAAYNRCGGGQNENAEDEPEIDDQTMAGNNFSEDVVKIIL